jgi:hypothetical protein
LTTTREKNPEEQKKFLHFLEKKVKKQKKKKKKERSENHAILSAFPFRLRLGSSRHQDHHGLLKDLCHLQRSSGLLGQWRVRCPRQRKQ